MADTRKPRKRKMTEEAANKLGKPRRQLQTSGPARGGFKMQPMFRESDNPRLDEFIKGRPGVMGDDLFDSARQLPSEKVNLRESRSVPLDRAALAKKRRKLFSRVKGGRAIADRQLRVNSIAKIRTDDLFN